MMNASETTQAPDATVCNRPLTEVKEWIASHEGGWHAAWDAAVEERRLDALVWLVSRAPSRTFRNAVVFRAVQEARMQDTTGMEDLMQEAGCRSFFRKSLYHNQGLTTSEYLDEIRLVAWEVSEEAFARTYTDITENASIDDPQDPVLYATAIASAAKVAYMCTEENINVMAAIKALLDCVKAHAQMFFNAYSDTAYTSVEGAIESVVQDEGRRIFWQLEGLKNPMPVAD